MTDFVDLRLFPREGVDFLSTLPGSVYGLVGAHTGSPEMTLAEELAVLRNLHVETATRFDRFIVYGEADGQERGLILFGTDAKNNGDSALYVLLEKQAQKMNQRGFCFGYRGEPACKFLVPEQDYADGIDLPQYDGSAAVLNQWADRIFPGFQVKGYFPRDVLYVQRKLREHGV